MGSQRRAAGRGRRAAGASGRPIGQKQVTAETEGSVGWRCRAERQLLVAAAAQQNKPLSFATFEALRTHGGVELGDLVLASGGFTTASDAQLQEEPRVVPGDTNVAQYVSAARGYERQSQSAATDGDVAQRSGRRALATARCRGTARRA